MIYVIGMNRAMKTMRLALLSGALAILLAGLPSAVRAAELVMFEEAGCPWCAAWNREIAPIYPKTPEGQRAPLRRVDLHATWPAELADLKGIRYTPTFVLVDDGKEIGRIQGYPGEAFFWGLLADLVARLNDAPAPNPDSGSGQ